MVMTLKVQEASVKTASVEIKSLTVAGKQVTLAVFRQLKVEELIIEDCDLAGIPWGIVNYHWKDCAGGYEHFHVVWQKGDELRQAPIVFNLPPWIIEALNARVWTLPGLWLRWVVLFQPDRVEINKYFSDKKLKLKPDGKKYPDDWTAESPRSTEEEKAWLTLLTGSHNEYVRFDTIGSDGKAGEWRDLAFTEAEKAVARVKLELVIEGIAGKLGIHAPVDEEFGALCVGEYNAAVDRIKALRARYAVQVEALKKLDQLFIAV